MAQRLRLRQWRHYQNRSALGEHCPACRTLKIQELAGMPYRAGSEREDQTSHADC
jgi:hypothetical protein